MRWTTPMFMSPCTTQFLVGDRRDHGVGVLTAWHLPWEHRAALRILAFTGLGSRRETAALGGIPKTMSEYVLFGHAHPTEAHGQQSGRR